MKIFLSKTHADENGPMAEEGKLGIIYGNKGDIIRLCDYFDKIRDAVINQQVCHMHFRDDFEGWNKDQHIDLEINIED